MKPGSCPVSNAADRSASFSLAQRMAFLQITSEDRERLRHIAPSMNESMDDFVETFYNHLFSFPETARFLHDPALVERLKRMQRKHLQSMLEGELNDDYAEQRRKVGDVHAHVGLDPRLFLGAYNQY